MKNHLFHFPSFNNNIHNKSYTNISSNDPSKSINNSNNIIKSYKKEKYLINCNNNKNTKIIYKINSERKYNNINIESEEELSIIESLWNDLGVDADYQLEFKNYISSIDDDYEKLEMLNSEKNCLRKLREALIKLSVEVNNRENNIFKLKKYNGILDKYTSEKKEQIDKTIFNKIQETIKYLRINAVNLINQIQRIREISSYSELRGKSDHEKSNRAYLYNSDYLLNMTKNLLFINNSTLFNYIETENGIKKTDMFFSNCKNIITSDNMKLNIPISVDLKNAINKCKYIILKDTIFSKIKKENITKNKKVSSPRTLRGNNSSIPKSGSDIYLVNESDSKRYISLFGHNKINLSRTLYYLKRTMGNDYEKMFLKTNNKNSSLKENQEIFDKYFHVKIKNDKNSDFNNINNSSNSTNINNHIIIEHSGIKMEDKHRNFSCKNRKILIERINDEENKNNNTDIYNIERNQIKRTKEANGLKKRILQVKNEEIFNDNNVDYIFVDSKKRKEQEEKIDFENKENDINNKINNNENKYNDDNINNNNNINNKSENNIIETDINNDNDNEHIKNSSSKKNENNIEEEVELINNEKEKEKENINKTNGHNNNSSIKEMIINNNNISNENNLHKDFNNNNNESININNVLNKSINDTEKKLNKKDDHQEHQEEEIMENIENNDNKKNNIDKEENKEKTQKNDNIIEENLKKEEEKKEKTIRDNESKKSKESVDENKKENNNVQPKENIKIDIRKGIIKINFGEISADAVRNVNNSCTQEEKKNMSVMVKKVDTDNRKGKLIHFRRYTEEEIKRKEREFDDDEEEEEEIVDYVNVK